MVVFAVWPLIGTAASAQAPPWQMLVDLSANRLNLWRGTPRSEEWSLYPALSLGVPFWGGTLSAAVRGTIEVPAPEPRDFSLTRNRYELAEHDLSLQFARRFGRLDVIGGVIRYQLQNPGLLSAPGGPTGDLGPGPWFHTSEIYSSVTLHAGSWGGTGLNPTIRYWHDFESVRGGFAEVDLTLFAPLLPLHHPIGAAYLSGKAGFSLGQSVEDGQTGYFTRDGISYYEVQVTGTNTIFSKQFRLGASYHMLFGKDPATRLADPRSPVPSRDRWGWFDVWLTFRFPRGSW